MMKKYTLSRSCSPLAVTLFESPSGQFCRTTKECDLSPTGGGGFRYESRCSVGGLRAAKVACV